MSKENNLTDFLTDVADAIREKKGTTELINPQNFSEEIRSIESGSTEVEEKDVNFYDYDGTLLFSYTIPEAQALTELPTPKGHSGLIFDGWNWDYEDVIALDYPMNIGAMYRTDDGKTRLYLKVEEPTNISLSFKNDDAGTVTVDFGDGEVVETSETTPVLPHRYEVGEYVLRISGTKQIVCNYTNKYNIFGNIAGQRPILRKVEVGGNFAVQSYVFSYCMNLETITYPSKTGVYSAWSSSTFGSCVSIKWMNVTKNTSALSYLCVAKCTNLRSMTVPKIFKDMQGNAAETCFTSLTLPDTFSGTFALAGSMIEKFRIPSGVTNLSNAFQGCKWLKEIDEPSSITKRNPNVYANCPSLCRLFLSEGDGKIESSLASSASNLRDVVLKGEITSIGSSAFMSCTSLGVLDFTKNTVVPTLDNINAFSYCDCQFVVPDALYDEWIAATNWSTYADRIVKESEYVYIDFADPVVEKLCAENFGDGIGTTQAQANRVTTFPSIFQNNTEITSFDEFERFENVTDLGFGAFKDCTSLRSITFPNLKNLLGWTFLRCSSLDIDVNLPSLMTISGDRQFNLSGIRKVSSLGSITSIPDAMFENCTNLVEVTIPSSCATISVAAFSECTALQSIVCNPTTPPVLNASIPYQSIIYVPDESVGSYKSATNWSAYADKIKPLSEYQPITE